MWGIGLNECFIFIGVCVFMLNTLLLLLCWLPPILPLRIKILLTASYCIIPMVYFVAWEQVLPDFAASLGPGNWFSAVRPSQWEWWFNRLRLFAEFSFLAMALGTLVWVLLDISRRHHNLDIDDPDDLEAGA